MRSEISNLAFDSREVREHSLFLAIEGEKRDGHDFVPDAIRLGAAAIVSERAAPADFNRIWVQVEKIRPYMAMLAAQFYDHPSEKLALIGVTGTNGKTTTSYLIHSILSQRQPALMVGTIATIVGNRSVVSQRTTPEAPDVQRALREGVETGCSEGVLEVSSHALAMHRVQHCRFPVAVFTNLSQDHLDYHGTLEDYFAAKQLLFRSDYNPALKTAVLNGDDPFSARVKTATAVQRVLFGRNPVFGVHETESRINMDGTQLTFRIHGRRLSVRSPLVGHHNVENILAAAAATSALGIPDSQIIEGIEGLSGIPGRFERVDLPPPYSVFVDYAHTPDALRNALRLCRSLPAKRVICVFGCGGDRDRSKRPRMGRIASNLADHVILTSDNPRSENPDAILQEIEQGVPAGTSYQVVVDRREAIATALNQSKQGDLVLIAGKGHETYQESQGHQIHFDDREVAREVL